MRERKRREDLRGELSSFLRFQKLSWLRSDLHSHSRPDLDVFDVCPEEKLFDSLGLHPSWRRGGSGSVGHDCLPGVSVNLRTFHVPTRTVLACAVLKGCKRG